MGRDALIIPAFVVVGVVASAIIPRLPRTNPTVAFVAVGITWAVILLGLLLWSLRRRRTLLSNRNKAAPKTNSQGSRPRARSSSTRLPGE